MTTSAAAGVWLTAKFFGDPWAPKRTDHKCSTTPFTLDQNLWKIEFPKTTAPPKEPPSDVSYSYDWDDDVSLLADDPDEDDTQLLPHSTYNVLAPLFDEIYKDDSEIDDLSDGDDDIDTQMEGARAA